MKFQPEVLSPSPDPEFVRHLKRIDKDLRVVWAYSRYLEKKWAVERETPPERYFAMYSSVLEGRLGPRFIKRPIFDQDQPIFNDAGEHIGYAQVGEQDYDLAPRHEWLMFSDTLDEALLVKIRRAYAWNINHPHSRERYEAEEQAKKDARQKDWSRRYDDATDEAIDQAFLETGKRKQYGYGATRPE